LPEVYLRPTPFGRGKEKQRLDEIEEKVPDLWQQDPKRRYR
jgi:tetrahydromethanopterin S-methyltransferase subunit G